MKRFIGIIALFLLTFNAQAQYGSYFGFSGGATINSFQTKGLLAEESIEPNFGLHFSGIYGFRFSDYVGFQTGLQYTAKGGVLNYHGESRAVLHGISRDILITGTREMERRIKYHSINVPVQATFTPVNKIQIGIGGYVGMAVASKMTGYYEITDAYTENQTLLRDPYKVHLSGSYFNDMRGPGSSAKVRPGFVVNEPEPEVFSLEGELISYLPESNPYDEHAKGTSGYLNRFDAGLYASAEYKLRKGFSIGLAAQYQLSPVTNPKGDLNYKMLDEDNVFLQADTSKRLWNAILYLAITF